jgi:hypothetical protein
MIERIGGQRNLGNASLTERFPLNGGSKGFYAPPIIESKWDGLRGEQSVVAARQQAPTYRHPVDCRSDPPPCSSFSSLRRSS